MEAVDTKKDSGINIEVRSEILEYSLNIEGAINDLLLVYLGIIDKSSTKLFGNKVGISFKNKIDLLFDINVLSKEEHNNLELFMNFRNKFLHAIECNSYSTVLNQFDNGIQNRFKKYIDEGEKNIGEESYRKACGKLYAKNLDVILKKFALKRQSVHDKTELIKSLLDTNVRLLDTNVRLIDSSFNFIDELLLLSLESVDFENSQVQELSMVIASKCENFSKTIETDKEYKELTEIFEKIFYADGNLSNLLK